MVDTDSAVRKLAKGGGIIFAGFFLESGLSFIAKILMAQILGRVSYGSVSIGIVMAANLSTIAALGLQTGVGRFLPRQDEIAVRRGLLLTAYLIVVPVSLFVGLVVFFFSESIAIRLFNNQDLKPVIQIFAIVIPFASVMKLSIGGIQGMQKSLPKVAIRNITEPVVRFVAIIIVLYLGFRSLGISYAYLTSYAVAALLGLIYIVRNTPILAKVKPVWHSRELVSYSAPLAFASLASLIVSGIGIDTLMIGMFADSVGDVGIYNVIYPLANLLTLVFSSLSFLFMPVLSELHAEGETNQLIRLYQVATKWVVLVTLPLFLTMLLFPRTAIVLTFGQEYAPGAIAFAILGIGFFAQASLGLNRNVLESLGRTRHVFLATALAAGVNVVLNILLVPSYSYLGAAVGTAAAYLVLTGHLSIMAYSELGALPFTRSLTQPAAVGISLFVGVSVLAHALIQISPLRLVGLLAFVGPLYLASVLRFGGIQHEEIMLVLSLEERFGIDLGPLKTLARHFLPDHI